MVPKTVISGCRTTKIYCRPGCPPGRRTKPENRVYFDSINEARVKGYRACKVCEPDGLFEVRETFFFIRYWSPLGPYILANSNKGVVCVKTEAQAPGFLARWEHQGIELMKNDKKNQRLIKQLDAYFKGKRSRFNVPLDLRGTLFQRQVWEALWDIPWGKTRSYGQIAEALGRPKSARAVGRAVGTNPVAIVVPCHRVIGADASLTGYGGGLDRKTALLELEGFEVT